MAENISIYDTNDKKNDLKNYFFLLLAVKMFVEST